MAEVKKAHPDGFRRLLPDQRRELAPRFTYRVDQRMSFTHWLGFSRGFLVMVELAPRHLVRSGRTHTCSTADTF